MADSFEATLNSILLNTFNYILRFEALSLKAMADTPVTLAEAHLLEVIGKQDKQITVSEIASALGVAASTATVAIKKLERKGLVAKTAYAGDARRFIVSLTEQGKRIDRAHGMFHMRMVRNISRDFSREEKDILLSAMHKLSAFFKERVEA